MSGLAVVTLDRLRPLLDRRGVLEVVREALIWQSEGRVQSPLPGQLVFESPRGDCHIKYGHVAGAASFAIKIATGFYDNPRLGLPVNHGLVLVLDARTGAPRLLLDDQGWLTAWRTAAATALAAAALAPPRLRGIGVIGTGLQAALALEWLPETLAAAPYFVWGRRPERAAALAAAARTAGREVTPVASLDALFGHCNVVVTATPASAAVFSADQVRPGTHLVALGADTPGKQELPVELFTRAAHVLTDDHAQCLDHGDFGTAVRAGAIAAGADVMLGHVLGGRQLARADEAVTIADLTGIAAEDIAIAGLFAARLADAS